jgi:hypothetical protein
MATRTVAITTDKNLAAASFPRFGPSALRSVNRERLVFNCFLVSR